MHAGRHTALHLVATRQGLVWIMLATTKHVFQKKSRMYEGLNEIYLQIFLGMSIIFRDESNDGN